MDIETRMNRELARAAFDSDLNNYDIENKAGLPYTKLSKIIHGVIKPTWNEKERIASVLGKSVKSLFPENHAAVRPS